MNNAEKNSYVRNQITKTLMQMLKEKDMNDISVKDLCDRAEVGRASFYRNYETKEDIITSYIVQKWRAYEKEYGLIEHQVDEYYRVKMYFEFCYSLKSLNDILIRQNQIGAILRSYETIIHNFDQEETQDTYERTYMAYGLYGIFIKWARGGYQETPAEMTEIVLSDILSAQFD